MADDRKPSLTCAYCGVAYWPRQVWQHALCKTASVVANTAAVAEPVGKVANSKTGKYADREKRRAYMRNYMARKRMAGG